MSTTETMLAARWHPPSHDIRVVEMPIPEIQDPDDAIVKVTLAGLCGSDLHIYRGQLADPKIHTSGHELIGEVVKVGANYGPNAAQSTSGRPGGYATLKVGDKIVAPFTANCGECHVCRVGYTSRCPHGYLFGSPKLDGGQAQYARVPKAGGTLYNLSSPDSWSGALSASNANASVSSLLDKINETSLLLLSDILPTGVFAATQLLAHPKMQAFLQGRAWPNPLIPNSYADTTANNASTLTTADRFLTIAIIGLGPVGVCASVALLDRLAKAGLPYRIIAIDLNESRRVKMKKIYETIGKDGKGENGDSGGRREQRSMTTAYELVRAFGNITSVGVQPPKSLPFTGMQLYDKNISLDFGRCPARSMFPLAFELLVKRQDVFGTVGAESSLIDRVVDLGQATEMYRIGEAYAEDVSVPDRDNKDKVPDIVVLHQETESLPEVDQRLEPLVRFAEEIRRKHRCGRQTVHQCTGLIGEFKRNIPRQNDMKIWNNEELTYEQKLDKIKNQIDRRLAEARTDLAHYCQVYFNNFPLIEEVIAFATAGPYWQYSILRRDDVALYLPWERTWLNEDKSGQSIYFSKFSSYKEIGTESDGSLTELRDIYLHPLANDDYF
ncbi:hypothetical protein D9757_011607 [Collybiopsis confluens]|uniref:Alcohol dehydrogenase-like N-terminal domain-containing protein n=1 Tax=Collybiopsis confluens TaxID=2823264 RepID=A0A8H5LWS2_9AGAR|nr:hypothetical protein D9757_011607 [Collybiopsis confluens]